MKRDTKRYGQRESTSQHVGNKRNKGCKTAYGGRAVGGQATVAGETGAPSRQFPLAYWTGERKTLTSTVTSTLVLPHTVECSPLAKASLNTGLFLRF
jgi:hypothetical protein